ncbi:uncharacterized protein LOC113463225 isoform X2 [Phoenix dactylifera]|uniref:Uncharacterized protein LOC113463225 isoform X2 n=1 Tax=Phoenix dactylifera TaxID=42345 RepID=A0A8B8Z969_PHODC|nr:uncharacterized protein LOC113463225 isoform X2 [Phoenix dactylifera]
MLGSAVIQSPSSFPLSLHPFSFPRKQKYPSHTRCFFFSSTRPETVFPRPFRRSLVSESTPEPIGFTPPSSPEDGLEEPKPAPDPDSVSGDDGGDGSFEIEIEKLEKKNGRRIRARIRVEADLETVWSVLTDYDGLADFIPNLAVSQLIEKKDKFARLYQIDNDMCKDEETMEGKGFQTTLLYFVELEPKLWIPVRLLEGRVCREIKINLQCIREEAQRVQEVGHEALPTWP